MLPAEPGRELDLGRRAELVARLGEQREETRRFPQQDQAGPRRLREALQQAAEGPRSIKVSPSARGHLRVASLLREQEDLGPSHALHCLDNEKCDVAHTASFCRHDPR